MARYMVYEVASGIVVNAVDWDGNVARWRPPVGFDTVLSPRAGEIGDTFNPITGRFTPPLPTPPPRRVQPTRLGDLLVTKGVITPAELDTTIS